MKSFVQCCTALLLAMTFMACASAPTMPSNRAAAINLCKEAYDVYWGRDWGYVVDLTSEAIGHDPQFAWSYSLRGVARTHLGYYALAVQDLNLAIELNPDYQPAYTNRGIANMKMGMHNLAEKDLLRAMEMDQSDVISAVNLAEIYAIELDPNGACRMLNEALRRGLNNIAVFEGHEGLNSLREEDCYLTLVESIRQQQAAAAAGAR